MCPFHAYPVYLVLHRLDPTFSTSITSIPERTSWYFQCRPLLCILGTTSSRSRWRSILCGILTGISWNIYIWSKGTYLLSIYSFLGPIVSSVSGLIIQETNNPSGRDFWERYVIWSVPPSVWSTRRFVLIQLPILYCLDNWLLMYISDASFWYFSIWMYPQPSRKLLSHTDYNFSATCAACLGSVGTRKMADTRPCPFFDRILGSIFCLRGIISQISGVWVVSFLFIKSFKFIMALFQSENLRTQDIVVASRWQRTTLTYSSMLLSWVGI